MPKKIKLAQVPPSTEPAQQDATPDWVAYEPLADFRLVAWESDESTVEVLLTSEEYAILKDHLARLRGYVVGGSNAE